MSHGWRTVGRAPGGPIGAVAVASNGLIACASLAGLAVSTDDGRTWRWPLPGRIGPFVADVAVADGTSGAIVVACAPTGLARSRDGGQTWELLALDAIQVALPGDGRLTAVLRDGALATVDEQQTTVGIQGAGTHPRITTLALGRQEEGAWALAEGRVIRADSLEGPWAEIDQAFDLEAVDLAQTSGGAVLAVGMDGSLKRRDPSTGAWSEVPGATRVIAVRAARTAPVVVALQPDAVLVSADAGMRWTRIEIGGNPISTGVEPDGSLCIVGLDDGRVLAVDLPGRSVRELTSPPSGLVTALMGEGGRLFTSGFLGAATSADGVDWHQIATPAPGGEPPAVAGDGSGQVLIAGLEGITDVTGAPMSDMPTDAIVALASDIGAGSLAVTDGRSMWTKQAPAKARGARSDGWVATPTPANERVVALAFGSAGTAVDSSLLAATVDSAGAGTVWLLRGSRWHPLASGDAVGGIVCLASLPGPRGVYAAMGDTLLRPATVGELVLAPEWPAGRGEPIHALAAARRESGDVVVVAGTGRVLVSHDGGYGWRSLEMPPGPPVTAMALRGRDRLEIVVARLGGELLSSMID
jgi:hypothetical protein